MRKFNDIRDTDKFKKVVAILSCIETLKRSINDPLLIHLEKNFNEYAETHYMRAIQFQRQFLKIQDYCEKFFDCEERGFSYELGCRYQKIDFDQPENIKSEISFLSHLLTIYSPNYPEEIKLIKNLISDLEEFFTFFKEYYETTNQ